jgi:hypothetical protein
LVQTVGRNCGLPFFSAGPELVHFVRAAGVNRPQASLKDALIFRQAYVIENRVEQATILDRVDETSDIFS